MGSSDTSTPDLYPPELMLLLATATRVLEQHVDDSGKCADCGSIWPCQHARLAECTLATF
jgi:hypothetical protein